MPANLLLIKAGAGNTGKQAKERGFKSPRKYKGNNKNRQGMQKANHTSVHY